MFNKFIDSFFSTLFNDVEKGTCMAHMSRFKFRQTYIHTHPVSSRGRRPCATEPRAQDPERCRFSTMTPSKPSSRRITIYYFVPITLPWDQQTKQLYTKYILPKKKWVATARKASTKHVHIKTI